MNNKIHGNMRRKNCVREKKVSGGKKVEDIGEKNIYDVIISSL